MWLLITVNAAAFVASITEASLAAGSAAVEVSDTARFASASSLVASLPDMPLPRALAALTAKRPLPAFIALALAKRRLRGAGGQGAGAGGQGAGAGDDVDAQLDQARKILNRMYSQEQEELDLVIQDCRKALLLQAKLRDGNMNTRAQLKAEVAVYRGKYSTATDEGTRSHRELEDLGGELAGTRGECERELAAKKQQEAIVSADLVIAEKTLNMTETNCQNQGHGGARLLLLQAPLLDCGKAAGFAAELAPLAKLKSPLARRAGQRMALLALGRRKYPKLELLSLPRAEQRLRRRQRQLAQAPAPVPVKASDGLAPVPAPYDQFEDALPGVEEPTKCTSAKVPQCGVILDALGAMVGEVRDQLLRIRKDVAETEAACAKRVDEISALSATAETQYDEAQVNTAKAVEGINEGEETLRQKVIEFTAISSELTEKQAECRAKEIKAANNLCAIRTIRQEVHHNQERYPMIQDCIVGDWIPGECSKSCGGGMRTVARKVELEADGGAECPPTSMREPCNEHECPIDCRMGDWSGWSECSKDCGGGVMVRSRPVDIEADHEGKPCEADQESVPCNVGSCDADCELAVWGPWGSCSKQCDGGIRTRTKAVLKDATGQGHCAPETSPERFEELACNAEPCPPNLVCDSKADLALLLDGSGSMKEDGFASAKLFAKDLLGRMSLNATSGGKAGLILFSQETQVVAQLGDDAAALDAALDAAPYPGKMTTAHTALATALDIMAAGGRKDVAKSETIVLVVTDGMPNDAEATGDLAEKVKARGRLVFVTVGNKFDEELLYKWASFPPEENILHVEDFKHLAPQVSHYVADLCGSLRCDEGSSDPKGLDYRGCQSTTVSGFQCQAWDRQYPQEHAFSTNAAGAWPVDLVAAGVGAHSFCRNPDGKDGGIWCYTHTDPAAGQPQWDYCDPRNVTTW